VWVPFGKLVFTKGVPSSFLKIGDMGMEMHNKFCAKCSTTLCIDIEAANFHSVAGGTISNNSELKPSMAIYTASAPKWATFPEGIQKHEGFPSS
jgi:hypothetical protein